MNSKQENENTFYQLKSGDSSVDIKTGGCFRISCCDCGLSHDFFYTVNRSAYPDLDSVHIFFRRNEELTQEKRRTKSYEKT